MCLEPGVQREKAPSSPQTPALPQGPRRPRTAASEKHKRLTDLEPRMLPLLGLLIQSRDQKSTPMPRSKYMSPPPPLGQHGDAT